MTWTYEEGDLVATPTEMEIPPVENYDEFLMRMLGLGVDPETLRERLEIQRLLNGDGQAPKPEGLTHRPNGRAKHCYLSAPEGKPIAGRNQPCPCGSGKKSKRCCRKAAGDETR